MPRAERGMLPAMPTSRCAFAARIHCRHDMLQRLTLLYVATLATIHARCTKESRRARDYALTESSLPFCARIRPALGVQSCSRSRALGPALAWRAEFPRVRMIERHTGRLGERRHSMISPWQVATCAPSARPPSTGGGIAAAYAVSQDAQVDTAVAFAVRP